MFFCSEVHCRTSGSTNPMTQLAVSYIRISKSLRISIKIKFTMSPVSSTSIITTATMVIFLHITSHCLPLCKTTLPPLNGTFNGNCLHGISGGTCQFQCNPGFQLTGSRSIKCLTSGQWDNPKPKCLPKPCPPISSPLNGFSTGECAPGHLNRDCLFTCSTNYRLTGNAMVTCKLDGKWSSIPPSCPPIPCPTVTIANGVAKGDCDPGIPGKPCNFSCNANYKLSGAKLINCNLGGAWTGVAPTCVKS